MRAAICLFFALLTPLLSGIAADDHAPTGDKKAFADAQHISDPDTRLQALKKFLKTYPNSQRVERANRAILEILVKTFPHRTGELESQVDAMAKRASGENRMFVYDDIAGILAEGNVSLDRAQKLSGKAVRMANEEKYIARERKAYQQAHMKVPDDANLRRDFLEMQSGLLSTLGSIDVKLGNVSEGKALLERAYQGNMDNSQAAAYLGLLAAKDDNDAQALTYLTRARLTGKLEHSQEELLETLYAKTHAGSIGGFEGYLDRAYAKLFPLPFSVVKFVPGRNPPQRTVLAELFTGSGCDPCAGADLAVDAELERYTRQELVILAFDEHIPEPDPLANPDSVKRFDFYDGKGTPTLAIDGTTKIVGASRSMANERYQEIDALIGKALQSSPEAHIDIAARRDGNVIGTRVLAENVKGDWKDLRLQIALVENDLRYSGENGIRFHPMVVRGMAAAGQGFPLKPGEKREVEYAFDTAQLSANLKIYLDSYERANDRFGPITFIQKMNRIDPANVSVVAFVQDSASKHVLQAAFAQVTGAEAEPTSATK